MGLGEMEMAKAMLASGIIGTFIATRWTFAAEVGGCQAEGGSAACMAAAALVDMAGGTLAQAVAAASMAFQSMLGLICDPIASRVEAPCLGKNVMAASNALACANMALADYDPVIPLDEVIATAQRVGGGRCRASCVARRWADFPSRRPPRPLSNGWPQGNPQPARLVAAGSPLEE
jgi:L-serine dehydratase